MWIDLLSWKDSSKVPLHEAILAVVTRYDASLKAEMDEVEVGTYSFRHAVCIVDADGKHYKRTPKIEELAGHLLAEYGIARGGTPSGFDAERWNYGFSVGYAMSFVGGPTEPSSRTRLHGTPTMPGESLRGREETFVYMTDDAGTAAEV